MLHGFLAELPWLNGIPPHVSERARQTVDLIWERMKLGVITKPGAAIAFDPEYPVDQVLVELGSIARKNAIESTQHEQGIDNEEMSCACFAITVAYFFWDKLLVCADEKFLVGGRLRSLRECIFDCYYNLDPAATHVGRHWRLLVEGVYEARVQFKRPARSTGNDWILDQT